MRQQQEDEFNMNAMKMQRLAVVAQAKRDERQAELQLAHRNKASTILQEAKQQAKGQETSSSMLALMDNLSSEKQNADRTGRNNKVVVKSGGSGSNSPQVLSRVGSRLSGLI